MGASPGGGCGSGAVPVAPHLVWRRVRAVAGDSDTALARAVVDAMIRGAVAVAFDGQPIDLRREAQKGDHAGEGLIYFRDAGEIGGHAPRPGSRRASR